MYLKYYSHDIRNFGDDINPWFWAKALGQPLDTYTNTSNGNEEVLLGIGTLINDLLPSRDTIHIMGSGAGYGNEIPKKKPNWNVHFVRGPLTAEAIGTPKSTAITDPVMMLNRWVDLACSKTHPVSFIPHVSFDSQKLKDIINRNGIHYISPSLPQDDFISEILKSEKVITSAMHGAIVADALRVPWLPISHNGGILEFKWQDFSESLNLEYKPSSLPIIWKQPGKGLGSAMRNKVKRQIYNFELKKLKKSKDYILSKQSVLDDRLDQLESKFSEFKSKHLN
jgi:succinoglycan biosynthesis protein ExoV